MIANPDNGSPDNGKPKKLTAKQAAFVKHYLTDLNATQAAKKAGYSKKTAASIGDENLRKPAIKSAISQELEPQAEKLHEDVVTCLNQLRAIVGNLETLNPTSPQLTAVKTLLQYHGMLIDKSEHPEKLNVSIQMIVSDQTRTEVAEGFDIMFSRDGAGNGG